MAIPMMEEHDLTLMEEAHNGGMTVVERERIRLGLPPRPPLNLNAIAERFRAEMEMYRLLSGEGETNPNALGHHIVSLYGPPCPRCSKPIRTKQARYCAACGYGMEEIKLDPRPLVERRASEFIGTIV